jgi:catechol 2,3-dioxygenase-like lactoylglutathione lyase family enzyme
MPTIDAIASVVEDMARTLDFYRLLGFDIPTSADTNGYVSIDLDGELHFAWNTEAAERSINPDWERPSVPSSAPGRMGITLRCADPAAVDALFRTVVEAGHTAVLEPFDAPWRARHCRVLDPDGNAVDLFAPLP